tara:strand:+ start:56 stop:343 length:288 start_codon:yes stop_codon:yes gene_type:complete
MPHGIIYILFTSIGPESHGLGVSQNAAIHNDSRHPLVRATDPQDILDRVPEMRDITCFQDRDVPTSQPPAYVDGGVVQRQILDKEAKGGALGQRA